MHRKQFDALASSFSLSEKSIVGELTPFGEFTSDHDEHSQTDILASGLNPCSRLPIPFGQWHLEASSPSQWRNRPRFSRGSLHLAVFSEARRKPHLAFKELKDAYPRNPSLPNIFCTNFQRAHSTTRTRKNDVPFTARYRSV